VSSPALDATVGAALRAGALGARLTGAGFGGSVIALARRDRTEQIAEAVEQALVPWATSATIEEARAGGGARPVGLR
jgi:galactokinase